MRDASQEEYWAGSPDDQRYAVDPSDPAEHELWAPTVDTDGDGIADSFDHDVDPGDPGFDQ